MCVGCTFACTAAKRAGMFTDDDRFNIALEPEAAAINVYYESLQADGDVAVPGAAVLA